MNRFDDADTVDEVLHQLAGAAIEPLSSAVAELGAAAHSDARPEQRSTADRNVMTMTEDWEPSPDAGLEQAVREAVGTASMCWEHPEGAGVFDSTRALWVSNGLIRWILDNM